MLEANIPWLQVQGEMPERESPRLKFQAKIRKRKLAHKMSDADRHVQ